MISNRRQEKKKKIENDRKKNGEKKREKERKIDDLVPKASKKSNSLTQTLSPKYLRQMTA